MADLTELQLNVIRFLKKNRTASASEIGAGVGKTLRGRCLPNLKASGCIKFNDNNGTYSLTALGSRLAG